MNKNLLSLFLALLFAASAMTACTNASTATDKTQSAITSTSRPPAPPDGERKAPPDWNSDSSNGDSSNRPAPPDWNNSDGTRPAPLDFNNDDGSRPKPPGGEMKEPPDWNNSDGTSAKRMPPKRPDSSTSSSSSQAQN